MEKQLIWVFEWRKSVHYWWSYILFSPECKELTSMLDPLLYRWGVPPVVIRCVHWTIQMGMLLTWIMAQSTVIVMFGFKSFRYFGAKLWNVLPADIKQSESLFIFKARITKWCYSDAAKALEEKMFWLPHYIISTMYLKWCRLYSNFKLGFSLLSACFLPL